MPQVTITDLNSISPDNINLLVDVIPMVSISANTTNKITIDELKSSMNIQEPDLSAVSQDILPIFDGVYDIGSSEKKFYDGYFTGGVGIGTSLIQNNDDDFVINSNIVTQGILSANIGDIGLITIEDNLISVTIENSEYTAQDVMLLNDLKINGDLNITGDLLQNGEPFSGGVIDVGDGVGSSVRIGNYNLVQQCFGGSLSGCFNQVMLGSNYIQVNSVISGGGSNIINSALSTIMGGKENQICNNSYTFFGVIGGGYTNAINERRSSIGGGFGNNVSGFYSTIGGGISNNNNAYNLATILGGNDNQIGLSALNSTIIGGRCNCMSVFSNNSTIVGGLFNYTKSTHSFIGGGRLNQSLGPFSVIVGGVCNSTPECSSGILGGRCNCSTCSDSFIVGSNITTDRTCTTFVNNISIKNIPTASAGLPSGSVWRCTADNTLRIV